MTDERTGAAAAERPVGEEARKSHAARLSNGFVARYLSGPAILDIGYKGYLADVVPIVPAAVGVELDYPGYDGVTLPFPDGSQDAVFASHCLEHIRDFRNAFQDWVRVLKTGGYLIIMVPHKFLYEKKTELPSNYNDDHKRFYTPASLMAEVEASLHPNSYRLRHLHDNDAGYDYALPPQVHSGGCYEIELVLEKIAAPAWDLVPPPEPESDARGRLALPPRPIAVPAPGEQGPGPEIATSAFGVELPGRPRILALKLDHLADFIIGLPSLRQLRRGFPAAHIHLVVGAWNLEAAEASGLADQVSTYDLFPENGTGWGGPPSEPVERFRALAAGEYDVAIDLRVEDDTRFLLQAVRARLRCGVGSPARFPFLDVALPPEHEERRNSFALDLGMTSFGVERFVSRMPWQGAFQHETDFRPIDGHAIYGPHVPLPLGSFRAQFSLHLSGWRFGLGDAAVTVDVARGERTVALRRLDGRELEALLGAGPEALVELAFENDDAHSALEFRVYVEGRPWRARLRFGGVRLLHEGPPRAARLRRAELHVGEQLSLLVQLLEERTALLYEAPPPAAAPRQGHQVVIAPFSNSDLRDWPAAHYVALMQMLVDRLGCDVALIGCGAQAGAQVGAQAGALERLAAEADRGARVRSLGNQAPWSALPELLRQADLVICNNSEVAHLAGSVGALTLAIFSASHQPQEWGPRGARSHAVMAVVPCSPCGLERLADCAHEHACMRGLGAEAVFQQAAALLGAPAS